MLDKLKSLFSRAAPEERAYSPTNQIELFLQNYSSQGLNESQILYAVNSNPTFFSCVNLIANGIASVDYSSDNAGVQKVLERPNSTHSKHTFFWLLSAYLSVVGKVYVWVRKDKSLVTVSPANITWSGGFKYQFRHGTQQISATLHEDLICIRAPDLLAPFSGGVGVGQVVSQELDIAEAAATHEAAYLHNHARPDMLVNYKGMSDDNLVKLKSGWDRAYKGADSSGKAGFSNADSLDVKVLNSSFKDLGLDKLRGYSSDVIREAFGIPKELLGAKDIAERSGLEGAEYIFAKYVINPRVDLILDELNTKLLPLLGLKGVIAAGNIVPADRAFALEVAKAFSSGVPAHMTLNEVREMQGLPRIKGGNTLGAQPGAPVQYDEAPARKQPLLRCTAGVFNERKHFELLFDELGAVK